MRLLQEQHGPDSCSMNQVKFLNPNDLNLQWLFVRQCLEVLTQVVEGRGSCFRILKVLYKTWFKRCDNACWGKKLDWWWIWVKLDLEVQFGRHKRMVLQRQRWGRPLFLLQALRPPRKEPIYMWVVLLSTREHFQFMESFLWDSSQMSNSHCIFNLPLWKGENLINQRSFCRPGISFIPMKMSL